MIVLNSLVALVDRVSRLVRRVFGIRLVLMSVILVACAPEERKPVAPPSYSLQEKVKLRGFTWGAPVFIRIFKTESLLELWLRQADGRYKLYRDYPICIYSGELGPKLKEGDKQAPEGFYSVGKQALNPYSQFHLSFNLGYPNQYDRAHGRTGGYLMVHGECVSTGCYAMGNPNIEEIYALVEAALQHGQQSVPVQALPFRLTAKNMAIYQNHKWIDFWQMLKPGYDFFEQHRYPPSIKVVAKRYVVAHAN